MAIEIALVLILAALMVPPLPEKPPDAVELKRGKCSLCGRTKKKHKARDFRCRNHIRTLRKKQLTPAPAVHSVHSLFLGDVPQADENWTVYSSETDSNDVLVSEPILNEEDEELPPGLYMELNIPAAGHKPPPIPKDSNSPAQDQPLKDNDVLVSEPFLNDPDCEEFPPGDFIKVTHPAEENHPPHSPCHSHTRDQQLPNQDCSEIEQPQSFSSNDHITTTKNKEVRLMKCFLK